VLKQLGVAYTVHNTAMKEGGRGRDIKGSESSDRVEDRVKRLMKQVGELSNGRAELCKGRKEIE